MRELFNFMRLKHIKLAGFKSFVDQTKVPFEHDMTAIVGPNGCGKSNIIDAVRWVLGESSAKNLRGDAMTDVIFNGANTRKRVGQASVELVFDNIEGRLKDSMADRNEVSIRRVVNRDSQNTYYLNGSKCRRRDITDIFLGTGLGPRSYAIIEQGTISRLIESKPQELRVFIEEAAGISKYKERRKDTENRIRHTRENLERLTDIRFELGQQIEHLHQQAEAATRFKTLKTQERKYKAELSFLKWQKFNQQRQEIHTKYQQVAKKVEQQEQQQQDQSFELVATKQQVKLVNEQLQAEQQQKLQLAQKVAAAEQRIKHFKQQQQKIKTDQTLGQQQLKHAENALLTAKNNLSQYREQLDQNQPALIELTNEIQEKQQTLTAKTQQQQQVQSAWQAQLQAQQANRLQHIADNKKLQQHESRIEHLTEQIAAINTQLSELQQADNDNSSDEILNDKHDIASLKTAEHTLLAQITQHQQTLTELAQATNQASVNYGQLQGEINAIAQRISDISSQQSQQQHWQTLQKKWLTSQHKAITHFNDTITVVSGWEKAIEIVLAETLKADVITQTQWPDTTHTSTPSIIRLVKPLPTSTSQALKDTLASKVSMKKNATYNEISIVNAVLNNVFLAEDYNNAQQILPSLNAQQSVICADGTWLGHHFLFKGELSSEQGYFQQQEQLAQLNDKLSQHKSALEKLSIAQTQQATATTQTGENLHRSKAELTALQQQLAQQQQQQALTAQRTWQQQQQHEKLTEELTTFTTLLAKEQQQLAIFHTNFSTQQNTSNKNKHTEIKELPNDEAALAQENQQLLTHIQQLQQALQTLQQNKHAIELSLAQNKQQYQYGQQNVERYHESIAQLSAEQQSHHQLLEEITAPFIEDEQQLQQWLAQKSTIESKIQTLHQQLLSFEQKLEQNEQSQQQQHKQLEQFKAQLNQLSLDHESARLKAENAQDHMTEMGQELEAVKQNIPPNAKESQWQAQLILLAKDISVLGAINLAAIDEYNSQLTRKNYLDQQDQDLNLAISTLESAIAKIDRESRQKFKTTFEQVNVDLQQLFPKVFGGGQAYLTLTGDDLLDTGVTIMARPPGKKNSTIHLLSGGEKALTALSLVFAIFRLNPAPFCMLDEVDAPLDDANVERFCNLVREMSQTVQFVYISHNKIAMEMASHLTGVTMFEAGVSRIVSVDIDEAIAMAEVS